MDEKTEKKRILRPKEKLINVLKEVDINSLKLDLPEEVKEITTLIYKDAEDKHLIRGKSIKLVVTASFYIACRQCNAPRTLSEVANLFNVTKTHLGRSYRILVKKLSIKLTPTSPLDFVSRLANKLFLSTETELIATEIIKQAIDKEITSGRDPNNVAVAALYIALSVTSDKKTQEDITRITGVTETTIKIRYLDLKKRLGINDSSYLENLRDNIDPTLLYNQVRNK